MTNRLFIPIVVVLTLLAISCASENMNGERTVSGKLPLESKTVEAERIADSLIPPTGSILLETRITSKEDLGVVVKKYSTDFHCKEIDAYFQDYLTSIGWKLFSRAERGEFNHAYSSSFSMNEFKIRVSCEELRDFRGIRRFYLSCYW